MEAIVEQIAREVMLKLKSESANRGSSYSPPPRLNPVGGTSAVTAKSAVLLTANFKVISQVLDQVKAILPNNGKLIISSYVYDNFGGESLGRNYQLIHSKNSAPQKALEGVDHLIIPAMSINSLSKAANLMADSFATIVLTQALIDGVKVTIADESIIDANRYFPGGVAKKIDSFRRELESMGVTFQRMPGMQVTPSHKCSGCAAGNCASCTSCTPSKATTVSAPAPVKISSGKTADSCTPESCSKSYGSCVSFCANKVKEVIEAGANRIEKGLEAPIPGHELARYIDHTLLKANATRDEIIKLCEEARENSFASVCVNPANVALSAQLLRGSPVKVCTVIGFPLGATSTFVKAMETRDAVANGATEIDMVINVGALKSKDYELVKNDIARVVEAANGNTVKVIFETSLLNDEEKVRACELSKLAGADFVKTSTGFSTGGATLEDICLMRQTVGPNMGVKASGGIRDNETAQRMIQMGATRIGASASVAIVRNEKDGGKGY